VCKRRGREVEVAPLSAMEIMRRRGLGMGGQDNGVF
jgi:hypothetical protein